MQVQVPKGHPNLVQPDLFALGLEFLIQHPVSRRRVSLDAVDAAYQQAVRLLNL